MANRNRNLPETWHRGLWSPFSELSRLQRSLDRMWDEYEPLLSEEHMGFTPACNLEETDQHYLVTMDLPGISKDNVKIEVNDNQLVIYGERKEEKREKASRHASERFYGSFQRVFALPSSVDSEHVQANYKNGVLRILIPKAAESKSKPIQITEGSSDSFEKLLTGEAPSGKGELKKEKAA